MKRFIALLLVLCLGLSLVGCKSSDYKKGIELFEKKQYDAAMKIFETLGDYKDCPELINECKYNIALDMFNSGDYESALSAFQALGDYQSSVDGNKSSGEIIKECKYNIALDMFNSGDYESALLGFQELGDYQSSADGNKSNEEMIKECKYNIALDMFNSGDYESALLVFQELGYYQSSVDGNKSSFSMAKECKYNIAMDQYNNGDYESALLGFQDLGDYQDSANLALQCAKKIFPMGELMEYIEANSTYLSSFGRNGLQIDVDNNATTVFLNNERALEFTCIVGSPVVDWEPMDIWAFADYSLPDYISVYDIGGYCFNYFVINIKMNPISKMAQCTLEYIEYDGRDLRTAKGTASFDYASYNGETSSFSPGGKSFNTDEKMFAERGNAILNVSLELMSRMLKKCGEEYSLKSLGWAQLV